MTIPDTLVQRKLDDVLCWVAAGVVIRTRASNGTWTLYVDDELVDNGEIALAVSILAARQYITWWPKHGDPQKACPSLDRGLEAYDRICQAGQLRADALYRAKTYESEAAYYAWLAEYLEPGPLADAYVEMATTRAAWAEQLRDGTGSAA